MTFEEQIEELCREALVCSSDDAAVEIIREMQALMHFRIEQLRSKLTVLASIQRSTMNTAINKEIA